MLWKKKEWRVKNRAVIRVRQWTGASGSVCARTLQRNFHEGDHFFDMQVFLVCVSLTWGSSPAVGRSTSRWCNPSHPVWKRWSQQQSQHSDGRTAQPGGWRDNTAHSKSEISVFYMCLLAMVPNWWGLRTHMSFLSSSVIIWNENARLFSITTSQFTFEFYWIECLPPLQKKHKINHNSFFFLATEAATLLKEFH